MAACAVCVVGALAAAGCKRGGTTPLGTPPPEKAATVVLPDGGMSHTEPLAEVRWAGDWAMACGGRRVESATNGAVKTTPGACVTAGVAGAAADARPQESAFQAGAEGAVPAPCRVYYEDISGDPAAPPARASLVGPGGRQLLDEWRVPREVDGDYFAVEIRVSPDGKRIAVLHVSVGIGDGDRLVRVESAEVRPAPPCR